MAGDYLDSIRKLFPNRATDFIDSIQNEWGNLSRAGDTPTWNAPTGNVDGAAGQLVYPDDLFSADSAPFVLFFAVDPVKVNTDPLAKIALYMPKELEVHYGINYGESTNYFQYGNILHDKTVDEFASNPLVAATGLYSGGVAGFNGGGVGGSVSAAVNGLLTAARQDTAIGQSIALNRKKSLNPHLASIYEGVNFRRHPFTFDLVARNEGESDTINQIIYKFKYHAHPEAGNPDAQNTFVEWPSSWQIGLFSPARKYLFNISTCQLTNFHVSYSTGGTRAFFSGTGAPVAVRISLEFMETEAMTRGRIRQGY